MSIVGGLDMHGSQITFDVPGTVTGEAVRGQVRPADREHLRAWLAQSGGRAGDLAVEGCTGWRYVAEEVAAAGLRPRLADPAEPAGQRGRGRHAKTDRADARFMREQLQAGRLPECWVPPPRVLEYRALLEACHDLRADHTAWVQPIRAALFHQGAPRLGGDLGSRAGQARLAAVAAGLSPAGQAQAAVALEVTRVPEERRKELRRQLASAARHLAGARELHARLCGVGPVTALALACRLGGAVLLLAQGGPVRRPGRDRLLQCGQAVPGAPVPPGPGRAALVPL
jgi:hypothetical protein